jgi:UPF0755 protein
MKRSQSCLLLLLVAACLFVFLGIWVVSEIPRRAEAAFGPASPALSTSQKFLLSWQILQNQAALTSPANPSGTELLFQIELGESPTSVVNRLEDNHLVQNASALRDFLVYAGLDTQIQAGDYRISPASTAIEIAYALLDATPAEVPFAILAGWRLAEIAESLPNSGLAISSELFLREAQNRNLEGYLLPGIYTVPRTTTLNNLLDILAAAFDEAITHEIKAGFNAQGLSVDDAIRLASIIEREAVVDRERPLIASVFLNRLAIGMKLEADPTVQYAVGYNQSQDTWWTNPLSQADLEFNSPYNTYLYPNLPPGPISSPSVASIKAVAFPAQTPYFYFRATCDGSGEHKFAETYEQHVENACP